MINSFVLKRYAGFMIAQVMSTLSFFIIFMYYGIVPAAVAFGLIMFIGAFVGSFIMTNPFTKMCEGKGILTLEITSTGLVKPFLTQVAQPYVFSKVKGQNIKDVFDRESIFHLATPKETKHKAVRDEKGGVTFKLTEEEINSGRFALFHYPLLIWNSAINSFVTKDFFSQKESHLFAQHSILSTIRKIDDLSLIIRDFARHVVEQQKPQGSLLTSKWVWIIVAVLVILLIVLFAPSVLNVFTSNMQDVGSLFNLGGGAVTPAL